MKKMLAVVGKFFAVIHRAIWRLGIFAWLGVLLYAASWPNDRSASRLVQLLVFPYLLIELVHVIAEFNDPHPIILGISDPAKAKVGFGSMAIAEVALWLIASWHRLDQWPWLVLVLLATLFAYLARPRPS